MREKSRPSRLLENALKSKNSRDMFPGDSSKVSPSKLPSEDDAPVPVNTSSPISKLPITVKTSKDHCPPRKQAPYGDVAGLGGSQADEKGHSPPGSDDSGILDGCSERTHSGHPSPEIELQFQGNNPDKTITRDLKIYSNVSTTLSSCITSLCHQVNKRKRKYKCSCCREKFNNRSVLLFHKKQHRDQAHSCAICEDRFVLQVNLSKHMTSHRNVSLRNLEKLASNPYQTSKQEGIADLNPSLLQIAGPVPRSPRTQPQDVAEERPDDLVPIPFDSSRHFCSECGREYSSRSNLRKHQRKFHDPTLVAGHCKRCLKTIHSFFEMEAHIKQHQEKMIYSCPECPNKKFSNFANYQQHNNQLHGFLPQRTCATCQKVVDVKTSFANHVIDEHGSLLPHLCLECGAGFTGEIEFNVHRIEVHDENMFSTKDNNLPNYNQSNSTLMSMMLGGSSSSGNGGKQFGSKKTNWNNNQYHWKLEEEKSGKKGASWRRDSTVTRPRNWKCEICGHAFHTKPNLDMHRRRHGGPKTIECDICDRKFQLQIELAHHMKYHREQTQDAPSFHKPQPPDASFPGSGFAPPNINALNIAYLPPNDDARDRSSGVDVAEEESLESGDSGPATPLDLSSSQPVNNLALFCDICNQTYQSVSAFKAHIKTHISSDFDLKKDGGELDADQQRTCKVCGQVFGNEALLKRHSEVDHQFESKTCECCGALFTDLNLLMDHYKTQHSTHHAEMAAVNAETPFFDVSSFLKQSHPPMFNSPFPNQTMTEYFIRAQQLAAQTMMPFFQNPLALMQQQQQPPKKSTKRLLMPKQKSQPSSKKVKTEDGGKAVVKQEALVGRESVSLVDEDEDDAAKLVNMKSPSEFIQMCVSNAFSGSGLQDYLDPVIEPGKEVGPPLSKSDDESKPLSCTVCLATFTHSKFLKRHMVTHSSVKKFKCLYCPKHFKYSWDMRRHAQLHSGDYSFRCAMCNAGYIRRDQLKDHMMKIHRIMDPEVTSNTPSKNVTPPPSLSSPENMDGDSEDRPPLLIDESSSPNSLFNKSISAKNYPCYLCGFEFTQACLLKRHMEHSHSDMRRYVCDICSKTFKYKWDLKRHRTTHTGTEPYRCHTCKVGFIRSDQLKNHLEKLHSFDMKEMAVK